MEMQPVKSSQIASVGHDSETNTLHVEFKGGGTYEYDGVPEEVFFNLLQAESVGQYFGKSVRGKYKFTKKEK